METKKLSRAQLEARRANARKSTGPRTRRGKRHSRRNSRKHGLYSDVRYFYWDAAMELGEDPREFQRLYAGLLEDRQPEGTLESVLVEDIAVLIWKKARLERAESAVQVCNVRRHDLERRKQYLQVGRDVTTVSQSEVLETGLRVFLDAPGTFEKLLAMLGVLEEMTERNEFTVEMQRLLGALYGKQPTLRGAGLINDFLQLEKLQPDDPEFQDAKKMFKLRLAEETFDVLGEYDMFLYEHVENSRAARIAATAPSHAQWAETIRQQNALHRQLERKIRLLDQMQERRKKSRASDLLAKLAETGNDSSEPEGPVGAAVVAAQDNHELPSDPREAPVGAALVAAQGQPQGLPLQCETQNRGNEAKKSLKTNEVTKTMCAKHTDSCAEEVRVGAKKSTISVARRDAVSEMGASMTSKERWQALLAGNQPDRIPCDYAATAEVTARLFKDLGCASERELWERLGIDKLILLGAKHPGAKEDTWHMQSLWSVWGIEVAQVSYGESLGSYEEVVHSPLAKAETASDIEKFDWPDPMAWEVSGLRAECEKWPSYPILGGCYEPFYLYCRLRGMEQALTDLTVNPEMVEAAMERIYFIHESVIRRSLEAASGMVDFIYVAEDMGTQNALLMSPATFRRFIKPWLRKMIDLTHSFGAKALHHDDGAIRPLLPELLEIGIDVLNPVQWRCVGMDREGLAHDFGKSIVFHGAVDNQQTLPFGSPQDVRREVAENIRIFQNCKGYIVAPCHNIQPNTSTENIMALYAAVHEFGRLN